MLNQSNTTPEQLYAFQTISDFVTNLYDFYISPKGSKKNKSTCGLDLYYRLISKVGFVDKIIIKHLEVFKKFCLQNRRCINKQELPLNNGLIAFSDKIFIDMDYIFRIAALNDDNTSFVIWQYLLKISALLDPRGGAKQVLSALTIIEEEEEEYLEAEAESDSNVLINMMSGMMNGGGDNGMDFFKNIMRGNCDRTPGLNSDLPSLAGLMQTVMGDGNSAGNPLEMIQNMMNPDMISNLMTNLSSTLKEQNIDMPKIFSSMHEVINKLETDLSVGHSGPSNTVAPENIPENIPEIIPEVGNDLD